MEDKKEMRIVCSMVALHALIQVPGVFVHASDAAKTTGVSVGEILARQAAQLADAVIAESSK